METHKTLENTREHYSFSHYLSYHCNKNFITAPHLSSLRLSCSLLNVEPSSRLISLFSLLACSTLTPTQLSAWCLVNAHDYSFDNMKRLLTYQLRFRIYLTSSLAYHIVRLLTSSI